MDLVLSVVVFAVVGGFVGDLDLDPARLATKDLDLVLLGDQLLLLHLHTGLGVGLLEPLDLAAAEAREQVLVLGDELACLGELAGALAGHALLVKDALPAGADLADALHGDDGLLHQVAVVALGDVAAGAEEEGAVADHLLAGLDTRGLCPPERAGVTLHLEVAVAF